MGNNIPYGRQAVSEADIQAVVDVLRSDFLTQGPVVPAFEKRLADYCGVAHAVAVNSATSALHIACLALEVGAGDRVWTSPNTFVASANCARYCGAVVDFVDIDPRTYNMSVDALRFKLEQAQLQGTLPKVVIPVHFAGQSCEMREIRALADHYGFRIIEDASHAIGGRYLSQAVGSCSYSDITVFSFHPVKIITTGEGGVATSNSVDLARRMQLFRSHCVTRDIDEMEHVERGPAYYEQIDLGYNYRMTDIQAALGTSQVDRLDAFVARRHEIAGSYDESLQGLEVQVPWQHPDSDSSWHLYVVKLKYPDMRREVLEQLRSAGVQANIHYIPVHTQPYYRKLGFRYGDFPESESYYQATITLPLFPTMTVSQQETVVDELQKALAV